MTVTINTTVRIKAMALMLFLGMASFFVSCDYSREDKGYEYFPDMAHSFAYETYSDNPAMQDSITMRMPVEGTVPTHMIPYPYEFGFEGREMAGKFLSNPFIADDKIVAEGEVLYNNFCSNCHGINGDGQGNLFTTGRYIIPPTSLLTPAVREFPQGEIYHVITTGWGVMGPHGFLIRPEDRWKIISFIDVVFHGQ